MGIPSIPTRRATHCDVLMTAGPRCAPRHRCASAQSQHLPTVSIGSGANPESIVGQSSSHHGAMYVGQHRSVAPHQEYLRLAEFSTSCNASAISKQHHCPLCYQPYWYASSAARCESSHSNSTSSDASLGSKSPALCVLRGLNQALRSLPPGLDVDLSPYGDFTRPVRA